MTEEQDKLLTVEEIAPLLKCSGGTVRKLMKQGQLPKVKAGKQLAAPRSAVMAYLHGKPTSAQRDGEVKEEAKAPADPDIAAANKEQALAEARMKTKLFNEGFQKIEDFERAKKEAEDWIKNATAAADAHKEKEQQLKDRERAAVERERQASIALRDAQAVIQRAAGLEPIGDDLNQIVQLLIKAKATIKHLSTFEENYNAFNHYAPEDEFQKIINHLEAIYREIKDIEAKAKRKLEVSA